MIFSANLNDDLVTTKYKYTYAWRQITIVKQPRYYSHLTFDRELPHDVVCLFQSKIKINKSISTHDHTISISPRIALIYNREEKQKVFFPHSKAPLWS